MTLLIYHLFVIRELYFLQWNRIIIKRLECDYNSSYYAVNAKIRSVMLSRFWMVAIIPPESSMELN